MSYPGEVGFIYLLHFAEPIGGNPNPKFQAQHYTGWASQLEARLECHLAARGKGASITEFVVEAGIEWEVTRLWRGTRDQERALKVSGSARRRCPVCLNAKRASRPARPVPWLDRPTARMIASGDVELTLWNGGAFDAAKAQYPGMVEAILAEKAPRRRKRAAA
jgi:hypothetical protein